MKEKVVKKKFHDNTYIEKSWLKIRLNGKEEMEAGKIENSKQCNVNEWTGKEKVKIDLSIDKKWHKKTKKEGN